MLRVNQVRDQVSAWARKQHQDELLAGMRAYLGDTPRTDARVMTAAAFALLTPDGDGPSLIERFAKLPGSRPRAERELFAQWAACRFVVARISAVRPGEGLDLHDVFGERVIPVVERAASKELEVGTWIAVFLVPEGGGFILEGTWDVVPEEARLAAVRALREADPKDAAATRRAARAVVRAVHAARQESPPELVLPDAWEDTAHAELGGRTPRQAVAEGLRAEVWALLPEDAQGDAVAAGIGLALPR